MFSVYKNEFDQFILIFDYHGQILHLHLKESICGRVMFSALMKIHAISKSF